MSQSSIAKNKLFGEFKIGSKIDGSGNVRECRSVKTGKKFIIKYIKKKKKYDFQSTLDTSTANSAQASLSFPSDLITLEKSLTCSDNFLAASESLSRQSSAISHMNVSREPSLRKNSDFIIGYNPEIKAKIRLDHPNIAKLYRIIETPSEFYLIVEHAPGGDLNDYLLSKGKLSEKEARKLFRQLVSALDQMAIAGVSHRDLKLENCLLTKEKNILISEFSLSATFNPDTHDLLRTICGTPLYSPPEILNGEEIYSGTSGDIWAAGVILYILVAGFPPFEGDSHTKILNKILAQKFTIMDSFSHELTDLFKCLFQVSVEKRITIDGLRTHPWIIGDETVPPPRYLPRIQTIHNGVIHGFPEDQLLTLIRHEDDKTMYGVCAISGTESAKSESTTLFTTESTISINLSRSRVYDSTTSSKCSVENMSASFSSTLGRKKASTLEGDKRITSLNGLYLKDNSKTSNTSPKNSIRNAFTSNNPLMEIETTNSKSCEKLALAGGKKPSSKYEITTSTKKTSDSLMGLTKSILASEKVAYCEKSQNHLICNTFIPSDENLSSFEKKNALIIFEIKLGRSGIFSSNSNIQLKLVSGDPNRFHAIYQKLNQIVELS